MIKIFRSKIFLFFIIILFIFSYLVQLNKNKGVKIIDNNKANDLKINDNSTVFKDAEYKFINEDGKIYTLTGKEASIKKSDSNIINLKIVSAFTQLNNKSLLKIKSDKATFLKNKKDIFFYENILITNKDMIIKAKKANLLYKENIIEIFDDVILQNNNSLLKCDKLIYDIATRNIELKMNSSNNQIYGKRK